MTHSHFIAAVLLFTSITACTQPIAPPSGSNPKLVPVGAPFTLQFTGLGTANVDAKITSRSSGTVTTQALTSQQGIVTPVRVVARGAVDIGSPGTGFRYIYAVVSVTSTQALSNVSFLGVRTTNALPAGNDTAISNAIRNSSGATYSDTDLAALVLSIKPAQAVSSVNGITGELTTLPNTEDSVQYLPEADVTQVPPGMVGLLPYGFTILNPSRGRTLSLVAEENRMVVGMKVPLAASPTDDPYAFSFTAIPVSDSQTRVTQSLEAQTPAGNAAVVMRAAALGNGATITMLPSLSPAPNSSNSSVALCSVRTAGPAVTPTASLINLVPSSLSAVTRIIAKGQTLTVNVTYSGANDAYYLPAKFTLADMSLGQGSDGALTALAAGTITATLSACGSSVAMPAPISVLAPKVLAGGLQHSLAIKSDGTVAAWGNNNFSQVTVPPSLTDVVAVTGGQYSSFALTGAATVSAWGYLYTNSSISSYVSAVAALTDIVTISAGDEHGLALDRRGAVLAWGNNGSNRATVPSQVQVEGNVVAIAAGSAHSLALTTYGKVFAWGSDSSFQVSGIPLSLGGVYVLAISAGNNHSLALKEDGTVVAWGDNSVGQLNIPIGLSDVVAISAGGNHNLALKSDGSVVAWGEGGSGQTLVPNSLANVVAVSASGAHSLALKLDGSIVGWGFNAFGQTTIPPIAPLTFKLP